MFRRAVPILASLDLDATVGFYESRLGFESVLVTDAHAIVERDGVRIHFWLTDDPEIPKVTACRIDVAGIQTLYEEMTKAGVVHPNGPLGLRPWGVWEFAILDTDGNGITFAEPG